MGHADIKTTMRYVHHIPKERAAAELSAAVKAALDETSKGERGCLSRVPECRNVGRAQRS